MKRAILYFLLTFMVLFYRDIFAQFDDESYNYSRYKAHLGVAYGIGNTKLGSYAWERSGLDKNEWDASGQFAFNTRLMINRGNSLFRYGAEFFYQTMLRSQSSTGRTIDNMAIHSEHMNWSIAFLVDVLMLETERFNWFLEMGPGISCPAVLQDPDSPDPNIIAEFIGSYKSVFTFHLTEGWGLEFQLAAEKSYSKSKFFVFYPALGIVFDFVED